MLKLVWVPKEFKNFSFKKLHEEMEQTLEEVKRLEKNNMKTYADLMILQNKIANLSEEEARHNLSVLIPFIESQFGSLKEGN